MCGGLQAAGSTTSSTAAAATATTAATAASVQLQQFYDLRCGGSGRQMQPEGKPTRGLPRWETVPGRWRLPAARWSKPHNLQEVVRAGVAVCELNMRGRCRQAGCEQAGLHADVRPATRWDGDTAADRATLIPILKG